MFIDASEKEAVLAELSKIPSMEEIYEVAGEYDIVSLVSTSSVEEFRDLLHKKILKIKGIKSTVISVILKLNNKSSFPEKRILLNT